MQKLRGKRREPVGRARGPRGHGPLDDLSVLASKFAPGSIERILDSAREQLQMEIAFVSEFDDGEQVYRVLSGDAESFGLEENAGLALEETYCQRVVEGRLPEIVKDARHDQRVSDLEVTSRADIGSYVGVPIRFSNGDLYGTLCCLSHSPDPTLSPRDAKFMHVLARLVADQIERERLETENWNLRVKTAGVQALLAALHARDGYTADHSQAVVELSRAVGREIGLPAHEVAEVEQVAVLHDVGKVGVPDAVLNKPGGLDEDEWEIMRRHPVVGELIISSIDGLSHLPKAIRAEHERWDGGGYPDGLAGEEIPVASCIVLACDAYHAMVSDRPYRKALGHEAALAQLRANSGTQFCPAVVDALLDVLAALKS